MSKWYINEISKLTGISVRMLRHYDKIGLLTPSFREENGYRRYSEQDLEKLEQIIALKYLDFSLNDIKTIIDKEHGLYAHLKSQQQVISKQQHHLRQVSEALDNAISAISEPSSPNWQSITNLIRSYSMSEHLREKLKDSWAGRNLEPEQFEDLLHLYEQFPKEFQERDRIIDDINNNKLGPFDGEEAIKVVCFLNDFAKKTRQEFSRQMKIGSGILKNIESGALTQLEINPEGCLWLGKATTCYWLKRWDALYESIEKNMHTEPTSKEAAAVASEWVELLDDNLNKGNKQFLMGMILWQETAKQNHDLSEMKSMGSPQEMIKPYHIKLFFNPQAATWISEALEHYYPNER